MTLLLTWEGKCSSGWAKPAHVGCHLPVAEGNTQELLQALVDGRKYIRDVFIELDRCFEDGTDQLRTKSEIEDDLLTGSHSILWWFCAARMQQYILSVNARMCMV